RWRRHSSQISLRSESLSPRRARKPRPNVYAYTKWTLGIRTAARDVVPDSPDATIWRDSGARVRVRASTCSDIYALQLEFSTAPECYGLLYLAMQERRLEHDPEKWKPVFPRDKRKSACPEIMLKTRGFRRVDTVRRPHRMPVTCRPYKAARFVFRKTGCAAFALMHALWSVSNLSD